MKFKFSSLFLVLLTLFVSTLIDNTYASVEICFQINGINKNIRFDTKYITYELAREVLNLPPNDIFKDNGRVIEPTEEERLIVNSKSCNVVISEHQESPVQVCISEDHCKTIIMKNSAKIKMLRDKLFDSLPGYYKNEKCADIYFVTNNGREIARSQETNTPYQNIVENGGIKAFNRHTDRVTDLEITWLLSSRRVRVNMNTNLSNLRYWITKPSSCPNLKNKLNLPDKPLFPKPSNDLADNWLARDRYAELNKVPSSHLVNTQLVAPYAGEIHLPVKSYAYKIQFSQIRRIYYVDVSEIEKPSFTGSRTDRFEGDHLTVKVTSRSPNDKILLALKDVRSTNKRAVPWTNVVVTTNNTAVNINVKYHSPQPGYAYYCELFDFRANYRRHTLVHWFSRDGVCDFDEIHDENSNTYYHLMFNKEELIENGEDLSKFRYEVGVTMVPYRPGDWSCHSRGKRGTGNIDLSRDHVTMGGAGRGGKKDMTVEMCTRNANDYSNENQRLLHFNVFIFRSQEIAEKIIEDVPVF